MTDPTGLSFLSYSRSRCDEAQNLIEFQHDLGVPTWRDLDSLNEEPTEEAICSVLSDFATANAVMWLTPEVEQSSMVRRVEVPLILKRHQKGDGFFVMPVAAGGLNYGAAADVVRECIGVEDLSNWNMRKVASDPANEQEVRNIALRVLSRRLENLHREFPSDKPLDIVLNTRDRTTAIAGKALIIDWTHRFEGRIATPGVWLKYLLPALADVSSLIQQKVHGRQVRASGLLSIPAATALGFYFMATRRLSIAWEQFTQGRPSQLWSLNKARADSGFTVNSSAGLVSANDLAVLVSVNADVSNAIGNVRSDLPPFRAYVHVKHKSESGSVVLGKPGEAVDVAHKVIDAIRSAREHYQVRGQIHLFMAVPVGLAMLIGQLLNTLGQVQTYEHVPEGATGHYMPSALLGA